MVHMSSASFGCFNTLKTKPILTTNHGICLGVPMFRILTVGFFMETISLTAYALRCGTQVALEKKSGQLQSCTVFGLKLHTITEDTDFWFSQRTISAGIWCENDVVLTSMRRDYVASTLIRRHFDTKCPLGYKL